jgi:hypothetical protein
LKPTPAPPWVSLLAAWAGALAAIAAIVLPFLPGSQHPKLELERLAPFSPADRFLPIPLYASTIAFFLGIIVFWQMRKEPRPLPGALINQRLQAGVGIILGLFAAIVVYVWVAVHGPR